MTARYDSGVSRSSVIRGPLAALACILQLLIGGGSGLADAWLEGASSGAATAHIEGTGSQSCPPIHSDDCLVCRHLTALYAPEDSAAARAIGRTRSAKPGAPTDRLPSGRLAPTLLARAPPLS